MESAVKVWHDTGKVDPRVNFLLDDQKTDTEKYAPVVNIEKVLCCLCLRMLHSPASYKLVPCRNLEVIEYQVTDQVMVVIVYSREFPFLICFFCKE
jgi:hypothetical protein